MKRRAKNNQELWEEPNKMTIPTLQQALRAFGVEFDPTERRGLLFQRYVQLVRVESPQSVERWTGHDPLDAPWPAPDQFTVNQIKIFLALYSIEYPSPAKRGHLVKLYSSLDKNLNPGAPVRNTTVAVVIPTVKRPSRSDSKKRKPNASNRKCPPPPVPSPSATPNPLPAPYNPLPALNTSPNPAGYSRRARKIRPSRTEDRQESFFSPYRRTQTTRSTSPITRSSAGPSGRRSLSQTSTSETSSLRRSSRLRGHDSGSQVSIKDESDIENAVLRESDRHKGSSEPPAAGSSSRQSSFAEPFDGDSVSQVWFKEESEDCEYDRRAESSEPPAAGSSSRLSSSADSHNMRRESHVGDDSSSPGMSPPFEAALDPYSPGKSLPHSVSPSPFETAPTPGNSSPSDSQQRKRNPSTSDSQQRSRNSSPSASLQRSPESPVNLFQAAPTPAFERALDSRASDAHSQEHVLDSPTSVSSSRHSSTRSTSDIDRTNHLVLEPSLAECDPESSKNSPADRDFEASSACEVQPNIDEEHRSCREPFPEDSPRGTPLLENSHRTTSLSPQAESPTLSSPSGTLGDQAGPSRPAHRLGTPRDHAASSPPPRTGKRKSEAPSLWPDPSELSREEIEAYLTVHGVTHNSNTRLARLIGQYNILRSTEQTPSKPPKAPRLSPRARARSPASTSRHQRSRSRAQAPSNSKAGSDEEHGFVYLPSEPPRHESPVSSASSSNYQPSLAYTERTEELALAVSQTSGSTRRSSTSPPIEKHRGKRAKNASPPKTQGQGPGRSRSKKSQPQPKGRRWWRRPSSTHQANDDINFVPALPETSKKRSRAADLSPNPTRAKQAREAPTSSPATRRRRPSLARQDSYRAQTSFHDNYQLEPPGSNQRSSPGSSNKQIQPAHFLASSAHADQTRVGADSPYSPGSHHSSTCPAPRQETYRYHENQYAPPSFHDNNAQEPRIYSQEFSTHSRTQDATLPSPKVAPRPKRKHPDFFSPTRASAKKRAIPSVSGSGVEQRAAPVMVPRLIPTSAQVRRRRQRQERPQCHSLIVRPSSLHDDEVFQPNRLTSPSGPRGRLGSWRNSVPRDCSPPPRSPPTRAYDHIQTNPMAGCLSPHDHTRPGPSAGCPCIGVGQNMLSVFTQATDRLTDCLERAQTASLRPSTSQIPIAIGRPLGNRDLSLLSRVRLHVKTLFGKTMELYQFPPPATEREMANWKRDQQYNREDDLDDNSRASSSSSFDDDIDPAFPYPDGPGHRQATSTTLKIMWRSMRQAGVVSFRPDLTRGARHVNNLFLWDLAHSIFIKLVRAQEYDEIDLENTSEQRIHQTIFNHAKHLQRTYRDAARDPQVLDNAVVMKRRKARTRRLCNTRVNFLAKQAGLIPLIPVINQCTSDAETEPDDPEASDVDSDSERPKRVIVERLPWRHPRIDRAIQLLDRLVEEKRQSGSKEYGKRMHERLRPPQAKISARPPPKSLSTDVYCEDWLRAQRIPQLESLNIQGTSLGRAIKNLEKMQ